MLVVATGITTSVAGAQQVVDVHAASSVESETHSTSWGGGVAVGSQWMPLGIAYVGLSLGADYLREQHLGRGRASLSSELTLASPWSSEYVVPYVGGAVSAVWNGGQFSQYTGARLGLTSLAGIKFLVGGSRMGAKIEGRYGYVRDFEHAFGTRVGVLIGL
jgi:hypothetical protein